MIASQIAERPPEGWEKARLNVESFLKLRESGAFESYSKSELIAGEMWGVFRAPEDCDQWDNMVPILLRPIDHDLLCEAGAFAGYAKSELIDGEVWVTKGSRNEL